MITIPLGAALLGAGLLLTAAGFVARAWRRRTGALELAQRELSRRLSELFSLQELTFLLSESLDPDRIVRQVARYVVRFLGADGAVVALARSGDEDIHIAGAEGTLSYLEGTKVPRTDTGILASVVTSGQLERADGSEPQGKTLLAGFPMRRMAVAPLRAHGTTHGAIAMVGGGDPFTEGQVRLLTTVAVHTATVLTNGHLFQLIKSGKEEWESTFDALSSGIALLDERGVVRRANRAFAQIISRPITEVPGVPFVETVFGQSPEVVALLDSARRGERPAGITIRSERWRRVFQLHTTPMPGTEPGGLVALIDDVTERKALEAQIIQHEKMAAVGQLVSGVAHELNNPLTSIAGLAELLTEQPGMPPRAREHLAVVHDQAERAGKIVRNLLTFARQGPAEFGTVDLNDVARRTALLIGYEVRLREVTMLTDLAPDLPPVRGDRYQLQQVVVNLLTNAVQAVGINPPGRPRQVTLRTRQQEDRVVLEVEDTGPGIPDEHLANIFDPFFTTKEPGQGTGLGLSLSFSIVARHGGTLQVHRGPDGGALFAMTIPATRSSVTASPLARSEPSAGDITTRRGTVLLVDADPAVRGMITALFRDAGHRVEAARDAAHGVQLLGERNFDLIIADPGATMADGGRFADILMAQWPGLRDRTILATADVRPGTEEWLRELGCRYVRKPFNAADLRKVAGEVLGQDRK
ncbi:MAG TPA: ATP-binding protein [Gemmatimonadales bacterium]|nr:ATP-binding protein [Gemmatimonadales bacterium]